MHTINRTIWNPHDAGAEGAWGVATASLDWCESNYKYSWYIAELFNTLSNIGFVSLALFGVQMCKKQRLPKRFAWCYAGVSVIGIGSIIFHMTLLYEFQLLDELPMIYTASLLFWITFDLSPIHEQSTLSTLLPTVLAVFNVAFTALYLYWPEPVFHQVSYGVLSLSTNVRVIWILASELRGTTLNRAARKVQVLGVALTLLSFFVWNLDNVLCPQSVELKARLGPPLSWLLEGHAWWHLGVGLGGFCSITAMTLMSLGIRDSPEKYELRWTAGLIPWAARTAKGWKELGGVAKSKSE